MSTPSANRSNHEPYTVRNWEQPVPHTTDLDLTVKEVTELASPDAITAFLAKLGYDTGDHALLSPEAVWLSGESASAVKKIELLSEDPEQFLRVVFAQPKSLTAKFRTDLVRVLGKSNLDHLLILASDFDTLEFVFLDKRKRERKGPVAGERIQVVPKTISISRRSPTRLDLRTLRRFTWTCRDALEQFDKLRSVFDAAAYTGEYFQNRGLFSDYFLRDRLREGSAWRDNPSEMFAFVRDLLRDAQTRWNSTDKDTLRNQWLEPLFKKLGFKATVNRPSKTDQTQPDYLLKSSDSGKLTAAFVYAWDRWLDGYGNRDAIRYGNRDAISLPRSLSSRLLSILIASRFPSQDPTSGMMKETAAKHQGYVPRIGRVLVPRPFAPKGLAAIVLSMLTTLATYAYETADDVSVGIRIGGNPARASEPKPGGFQHSVRRPEHGREGFGERPPRSLAPPNLMSR